ncbi:MAG: Crp/Fnr family transcriptional regulator [Anaerolineales bacterium]
MSEAAFEVLKKISYFKELPDQVIVDLARTARQRHFEREQVVYIEGESAENIFVLESGWVKVTRMTSEGREQALAFMQPGEVFGEVAAFTGETYPATVTALEPVVVWVISTQFFVEMIQKHPGLALTVIQQLGKRTMYFIGLVEDLALRSVEARLAHTLLRHAEMRDGQLIVPRRPWTTFDEMAVRLGTVRDVLSRALKTLEAEGLLRVEKQAIVLLEAEGLAKRGDL